MSSGFQGIPPDCRDRLFRYLTIQECLFYGTTSRTSLTEIFPDLQRRRKEQFLLRHAYQIGQPSIILPVFEKVTTHAGAILSTNLLDNQQWHTLPSVAEGIQGLYRSLSPSHPLDTDVQALCLDLKKETPVLEGYTSFSSSTSGNFRSCLVQLQKLTKAHRLHASLLSRCTVGSNPNACDPGFYTLTSRETARDPSSLTILLEHYMGDVLCVYYLLGHSIAGLVEGGPTHGQWINSLLETIKQQNNDHSINAVVWYRLWVYFHSAILRTFPFSPLQLKTLGLLSCGIQGVTVPGNLTYIHPHYPFMGTGTSVVRETTELVQAFSERNAAILRADLRTTFNRFGPLGPSFRGRDRVHSRSMRIDFLLHRLEHPSYVIPSTWFLVEQKQHIILDSPAFHSWFTSEDDVILWMLESKEECGKSRPMTVSPPSVTIEPAMML